MWAAIRPGNGYLEAKSFKELHKKAFSMIDYVGKGEKTWTRAWEKTNPEVALMQLEAGDML